MVAHLTQQLQAGLVGLVALLLDRLDVRGGSLHLAVQLVFVVEQTFVLALQGVVLLNKKIDVRLLGLPHLFQLGDMRSLFAAHLFQLRDRRRLLSAHLFQARNTFVRAGKLLAEDCHVLLDASRHLALAFQFSLHSLQVFRIDLPVCQAALLVLRRDRPTIHNLGFGRGHWVTISDTLFAAFFFFLGQLYGSFPG